MKFFISLIFSIINSIILWKHSRYMNLLEKELKESKENQKIPLTKTKK